MMTQFMTTAAPAATFRGRPKGAAETSRIQSRKEVLGKLPNILVSSHAVAWDVAALVAPAVYDEYTRNFGPPANVDWVAKALRHPAAKARLAELVAPIAAKLAAERPKPTPVPTVQAVPPPPKAPEKSLPKEVQEKLTRLIIEARQLHLLSSRTPQDRHDAVLDKVITAVVETCFKEGINWFQMPFVNNYPAAGVLIGRLMAGQKAGVLPKFFFRWTEMEDGGIADVVVQYNTAPLRLAAPALKLPPPAPVRTEAEKLAAAKARAEAEARKKANRDARLAAQPAKGKGGGDNKKGGKKGKK